MSIEARSENSAAVQAVGYNDFVHQQIVHWQSKGVQWQFPSTSSSTEDNESKDTESEEVAVPNYSSEMVESVIMGVYGTCFAADHPTPKFVRLLLLFGHQVVVGRVFASYNQVPESLRELDCFSTDSLLEWQWEEQSGVKGVDPIIPVNFRRVYLIFLTNYLNRIWKCYHIDLENTELKAESEEYLFIRSTQESLNEIIESTAESTVNKSTLSKSVVFQKIADHCCSLGGALFDAMRMRYPPITVHSLEELNDCISLITLQLNQLYLQIEEKWLENEQNYTKEPFKDKKGDENFVTLVINDQPKEMETPPNPDDE